MTREQYELGLKLAQTLRDIHDLEFYMPEWNAPFEDLLYWVSPQERDRFRDELGEEKLECGSAHCVGGWLMQMCGTTKAEVHHPTEWFARTLGLPISEAEYICLNGMDMTKDEKADQLEEVLRAYYRP